MLGDTTTLATDHIGIDNAVQQRRFTVVNMPEEGNYRGAWDQVFFAILFFKDAYEQLVFDANRVFQFDVDIQLGRHQLGQLRIHLSGDGSHNAFFHQDSQNLGRRNTGRFRKLADRARQLERDLGLSWGSRVDSRFSCATELPTRTSPFGFASLCLPLTSQLSLLSTAQHRSLRITAFASRLASLLLFFLGGL